jgi:hypothetical protein
VKVDGEEKQVKADELVKSYQLEQAAQKRMQEAAELKKQSEAQAQAFAQQREQYLQAIEMLEAKMIEGEKNPKSIGTICTPKTQWSMCVNVRRLVTLKKRYKMQHRKKREYNKRNSKNMLLNIRLV